MAWAENIRFKSPGFELNIPKWDFPEKGITCVWGASGSGKSTLLQIVSGIIPAPGFKLSVGGDLISELPARERNIGFVFQDYALFPHLSVWENICFPARAKNLPEEIWGGHAESLMKRLVLEQIRQQQAGTLSGGESQRVALARALVTKPRLVCLDEPLSALDEKLREEARQIIHDLSTQFGVPFLLVTHDLRDVRALSRSVLILSCGRAVTQGETAAVLGIPESLEVASLIPENQVLEVTLRDGKCFLTGAEIPVTHRRAASRTALVAKSWDFEAGSESTAGHLAGELAGVVDEGPFKRCLVRLKDGQVIRAISLAGSLPAVGGTVSLKVLPASLANGLVLFEKR
jgi:putative spermidine/putrescine transport system ATP-binding protein